MLHRIVRPAVVTLLIVTGLASAAYLWYSERQLDIAEQRARQADELTDGFILQLGDLRTALQAYVAPGQNITSWTARTASLLSQLSSAAEALEGSDGAEVSRDVVRPAIATLTRIDTGVREYLRSGDDLMAADLAFTEARDVIDGAVSTLRGWREVEQAPAARSVKTTPIRRAVALAGVLLPWALCFGVIGWRREADPARASMAADQAGDVEQTLPALPLAGLPDGRTAPAVDLAIAAMACGDFARATDGTGLRSALGRGAGALGAKGIVVWLGVGEELFAVASHGYDERHLKRPISRDAKNVTAEAWRTAEALLVPGEADGPGVVVVPMVGSAGCRGVVSAELLPGHAADADRQALLSMFAAQIVGLVGAAPAAPAAEPPQTEAPADVEPAAAERAS